MDGRWVGWKWQAWKPTFFKILSREIYLRIKLLFFFYETSVLFCWIEQSPGWFRKIPDMAVYRRKQGWPPHSAGSIRHLSECPTWLHCWDFRICLSNNKVQNKTPCTEWLTLVSLVSKFQQDLTSGNYSKIQEVLSLIEAIPMECVFP